MAAFNSLATLKSRPTLKSLPPIDGVASWSVEGSFDPTISRAVAVLPDSGPQNEVAMPSSEAPQSERLVHALLPMNAIADSALPAPMAEKQSVDTMPSAETEPAANLKIKTPEPTETLVPVTTGFGGLFNRFQSK